MVWPAARTATNNKSGLDFLFIAGQAAGQTTAVRARLLVRIWQNMCGGVGCGPSDIVARQMLAQFSYVIVKLVHYCSLQISFASTVSIGSEM